MPYRILIYWADTQDPKSPAAEQLVVRAARAGAVLTVQALGEYYFAITRKRTVPAAAPIANLRHLLTLFPDPIPHRADCLIQAASAAGRFPFWDGMLLATAA